MNFSTEKKNGCPFSWKPLAPEKASATQKMGTINKGDGSRLQEIVPTSCQAAVQPGIIAFSYLLTFTPPDLHQLPPRRRFRGEDFVSPHPPE
jgi:hypothetical protein